METCTVCFIIVTLGEKMVDIHSLKSKLESVNECKECQYDDKRKGINVFDRAQR